jgi:hypothetical protein|tara:strand:- start:192 stop:806 length:615 start_codon:yes stop_codon:yes gene_type:complete
MPQSQNIDNTKDSKTSKKNYSAIRYGNEKGSISFGHIAKGAEVTSGVMLQTPDSEHQLSLDIDGEREGWTTSTSPGNFQVECGSANEEAEDSLILNAKNGNIMITATNGKIRLQGTDIELVAIGANGDRGNIKMNATENITLNATKILGNAAMMYRLVSPQRGEIVSNGVLKIYGSIIRGVTDACSVKDSKVGGKRIVDQNKGA